MNRKNKRLEKYHPHQYAELQLQNTPRAHLVLAKKWNTQYGWTPQTPALKT